MDERTKYGSIDKIEDSLRIKRDYKIQNYRYMVIVDFEAVTDEEKKIYEIIEFPAIVVDLEELKVVAQFHHFVKPKYHKKLNKICINITGIKQEWVDGASSLFDVLNNFHEWLCHIGLIDSNGESLFLLTSCGDYDFGSQLMLQCQRENIKTPSYMNKWCNIKSIFSNGNRKKEKGMVGMMNKLNIPILGHHHSGIDDTWNLARLVCVMISQHQYLFEVTTTSEIMLERRRKKLN